VKAPESGKRDGCFEWAREKGVRRMAMPEGCQWLRKWVVAAVELDWDHRYERRVKILYRDPL
jgi:hypothetical protein